MKDFGFTITGIITAETQEDAEAKVQLAAARVAAFEDLNVELAENDGTEELGGK